MGLFKSNQSKVFVLSLCALWLCRAASAKTPPPFRYVQAQAFHILQETHSEQSGYFSLSESLDGTIHVGTAKYNENAFLVEFDPRTGKQRIVLDTNQVCGLTARGYAAQAKLHTRNFVGPSGVVYVGSKQGYPAKGDTSEYPGGYVMTYDPRTGAAKNLGMPYKGQGVIDVVADEARKRLYVVTCEEQHWMIGDLAGKNYREIGPLLTPYASTLIDASGRAHALTTDFQLTTHDAGTNQVITRPIELDGKRFERKSNNAIPTWILTPDQRKAYLILMNDPTLIEIDLVSDGAVVKAISLGKMLEGKGPDSRCALALAPDGKVYAVVRIDNTTGFGAGHLHHLVRYDPQANRHEDLGVLAVSNPDYFNPKTPDGKTVPHSHGFHRLPDDTLTPLHHHMAMMVARDGTIYVTVIAPFTLLKIDAFQVRPAQSPAGKAIDDAVALCASAENRMDEVTRIAELVADRHIAGGLIGFAFENQSLAMDLWGRSGSMMHVGFTRPWKQDRTDAEKRQDVGIVAYDRAPAQSDLGELRKLKERGVYLIGFGPGGAAELQDHRALCDAWIDSGVTSGWGRRQTLANAINGWTLMAETVGALTRRGKMPTIWKSYSHDDGKAWADKYFGKAQFHDDLSVPPHPKGELGRRWLTQIRSNLLRLKHTQLEGLTRAGKRIKAAHDAGEKVIVAWQGHMPQAYVGQFDDRDRMIAAELHPFLESQIKEYSSKTPNGALVLALGYHGVDPREIELWKRKSQKVILMSGEHPDPTWQPGQGLEQSIDLGFAFGDACVTLEAYPIRLFAPSGIMQLVAYEAILAEVNLK